MLRLALNKPKPSLDYQKMPPIIVWAVAWVLLAALPSLVAAQTNTVSLERTSAASIYEGETIEFTISLDRPLASSERADVPLVLSGEGIDADEVGDLVLAGGAVLNLGVTVEGEDGTTPTVIFEDAGAQVATLVWAVADDRNLEDDTAATIALGDLASDPNTTVALATDGTQNSFEVAIRDNEYIACFEQTRYSVDESVGETLLQLNIEGTQGGFTVPKPLPVRGGAHFLFSYSSPETTAESNLTAPSDTNQWDYIALHVWPDRVSVPEGATGLFLSIQVIDDQRVEGDEVVRIDVIPQVLPDGFVRCSTDLTIKDNDPKVTISHGDLKTISLGDPIPFIVRIPTLALSQVVSWGRGCPRPSCWHLNRWQPH